MVYTSVPPVCTYTYNIHYTVCIICTVHMYIYIVVLQRVLLLSFFTGKQLGKSTFYFTEFFEKPSTLLYFTEFYFLLSCLPVKIFGKYSIEKNLKLPDILKIERFLTESGSFKKISPAAGFFLKSIIWPLSAYF